MNKSDSKAYRSLILESVGQIRLAELPFPKLDEGDLLIEVKAATTCGTDLKAFQRGHPQIPMPGGFGHEYSGIVADRGSNAKFQIGEEIVGVHTAPCQHCRWCLKGQENLCETIMETKVLGSFAQFLRIPKRIADLNVFLKPSNISFEQGTLLEPLACVSQGLLEVKWQWVNSALVIGPGAIGLMFATMLQAKNIPTTVAGRNPNRLNVAKQMGLRVVELNELPITPTFDLVIECTGTKEIWEKSPQFAAKGSQVMLFGGLPSGTEVHFDSTRMHYDQITFLSPFHFGTEAVKTALDLLQIVDFSPLISGTRNLEDATEVFADLAVGKGIKYTFKP